MRSISGTPPVSSPVPPRVNQRLPSPPTAMSKTLAIAPGSGNSVMVYGGRVSRRPTRPGGLVGLANCWPSCVNQMLPSGPVVIPNGPPPGMAKSVWVYGGRVYIRTMLLPSGKYRFPSGPRCRNGPAEFPLGVVNSVMHPAVVVEVGVVAAGEGVDTRGVVADDEAVGKSTSGFGRVDVGSPVGTEVDVHVGLRRFESDVWAKPSA